MALRWLSVVNPVFTLAVGYRELFPFRTYLDAARCAIVGAWWRRRTDAGFRSQTYCRPIVRLNRAHRPTSNARCMPALAPEQIPVLQTATMCTLFCNTHLKLPAGRAMHSGERLAPRILCHATLFRLTQMCFIDIRLVRAPCKRSSCSFALTLRSGVAVKFSVYPPS